MAEYSTVVQALTKLGQPESPHNWRDYRELGVGPEHVGELIRLACDPEQFEGDPESTEVFGPLHAWRALAQPASTRRLGSSYSLRSARGQNQPSERWTCLANS